MLQLNVTYTVNNGSRESFLSELNAVGFPELCRAEKGIFRYDYFLPTDNEAQIFLLEIWADAASQQAHCNAAHIDILKALKAKYAVDTVIERFDVAKI